MKLIIDIDDKRIKGIKLLAKEQDIATPYPTLEQIIANGIPLDKIRAEISDFEEEVFQRPNTDYSDYAAVRHCLEIIDKYRGDADEMS